MKPLTQAKWNVRITQNFGGTWNWFASTEDDTGLYDTIHKSPIPVELDQRLDYDTKEEALENVKRIFTLNNYFNYKIEYNPMSPELLNTQASLLD